MTALPAPATILVVDDDEAKRYSIVKILQKAGFQTVEVATGAEALRSIANMPDLVILDVKLPDLSGFEVCRRIKADPKTSAVPILHLSTTFVDLEDRVQGLEGGADGYLTDVLEPIELIATVRALLRARRAEEAAQISNRQWQITFDAVNDGLVLLTREGHVAQVNQALRRMVGRPSERLTGCSFDGLLALGGDPESSPFLRMSKSQAREVVELTLDGCWLHVAVDPLRDWQGEVAGAICIVSDVTERHEMEEELRRRAAELAAADRRKDEFLAMLAHEMRNPLAPIVNSLELIRLHADGREAFAPALEIASRQVRHMTRLLDDLLDVSRFIQGKVHLRKEPVALSEVISHALETATPLITSKRHHLEVSLPDEPVILLGDETRLAQVVGNLVNNAAKYSEPGGQIMLTAQQEDGDLVLRVADRGIGMSPEMQERVFDLFSQADLSLDRTQGGLGIGLTLVRSLVELHGGTASVKSPGLGKGSQFIVRLPIPKNLPPPAPAASGAADDAAFRPLQVLVVDDHRDSAQSLARVLRLWGHDARVVHDGPAAIDAVADGGNAFDLVLLDIGLPGMDGYQVATQVRQSIGSSAPRLIALSGYGQEQDLERSRGAGFDDHLVKPVNLETLQRLLARPDPLRALA